MADIKDFKHAIVRQKILDAVRKDLIGPTSDCEQLNEVPTSSYITGLLYPADTDVTEDENYNDVEFTEKNFDADGETLEAGIFEEEEPEDRVKGGFQKPSSIGVSFYVSDDVQKVNACPGYITDALYRVENLDRYDDRLQVTTNLIEAYYLLMEFVAKHTSDKFCLINNISTSIRGIISREVIGNILVHRDYSSAYPAKVIIEKDWLRTENWCIPRRHGNIMSDEFTPYPKNPLIQQFFANIGRTDTIGSGVRNLYKYTPMYSDGGKPELIEDDVFRINIPLDRIAADEATEQKTLSEREQKIYNMICENLHLSVEQVMAELDISRSTVFRDYAKIKKVTGAVYDKKTSTWTL